jgi:hypothetical protein
MNQSNKSGRARKKALSDGIMNQSNKSRLITIVYWQTVYT